MSQPTTTTTTSSTISTHQITVNSTKEQTSVDVLLFNFGRLQSNPDVKKHELGILNKLASFQERQVPNVTKDGNDWIMMQPVGEQSKTTTLHTMQASWIFFLEYTIKESFIVIKEPFKVEPRDDIESLVKTLIMMIYPAIQTTIRSVKMNEYGHLLSAWKSLSLPSFLIDLLGYSRLTDPSQLRDALLNSPQTSSSSTKI
ncbi:hypothetical protein PPL_12047 [Heterostelium album PN500]|uniref:Uncharacterized protein n=1 Tax=Heterostelium pallidum (strain ATCC 26659 / Pp 5 / PN500) TaxID=670386 RepID=D3BLJ4_HETP5|nr:hypothetical protein PPL_12047 [Heterostelium album PN500]EFA77445.1 hypothetical protein PPL_12047 [Heterostelium album PN500]|eukprot:XP_020429573.1 hypothetical protein PPL_12047 [Heterostelium album PN500]